jgi:hypothetical protein
MLFFGLAQGGWKTHNVMLKSTEVEKVEKQQSDNFLHYLTAFTHISTK